MRNKFNPDPAWYILNVLSGYEMKVLASLRSRIVALDMQDRILEVLGPTESVSQSVQGGRDERRMIYPGTLLLRMIMSAETFDVVTKTPKASGFVGGRHPTALSEKEILPILNGMNDDGNPPENPVYATGEVVRIVDGSFSGHSGVVDQVDQARDMLHVTVMLHGRPLSFELSPRAVEKIA